MSEAIIAALKMAQEAGLMSMVGPSEDGTCLSVTISTACTTLSVYKNSLDDADKFIEGAAIALGQPRTVSMEDARAVCGEAEGVGSIDLRGHSETPSAGIDPEATAAPVTFKTIRDRVLSVAKAGEDRVAARWALTQAAHELRQVPTQSFWNAADELEGIVRDRRDPHAEVPA